MEILVVIVFVILGVYCSVYFSKILDTQIKILLGQADILGSHAEILRDMAKIYESLSNNHNSNALILEALGSMLSQGEVAKEQIKEFLELLKARKPK